MPWTPPDFALWETGDLATETLIKSQILDNLAYLFDEINAAIPVGTIMPMGRASAPTHYLPCDGALVNRTTYADLFAAIGTAFGVGDGSTTFGIPDMRGRFPLGRQAGAGTGEVLGEAGGALDHTHTNPTSGSGGSHAHNITNTGTAAAHIHDMPNTGTAAAHTHSINSFTGGASGGGTATNAAGGHAHGTGGPTSIVSNVQGAGDISSAGSSSHGHSTGTDGSHAHSIPNHDHQLVTNTASGGSHAHTNGNTVSGGSHAHTNPDTDSGGSHTHTQGATGTQNPPYLTLIYYIKAENHA